MKILQLWLTCCSNAALRFIWWLQKQQTIIRISCVPVCKRMRLASVHEDLKSSVTINLSELRPCHFIAWKILIRSGVKPTKRNISHMDKRMLFSWPTHFRAIICFRPSQWQQKQQSCGLGGQSTATMASPWRNRPKRPDEDKTNMIFKTISSGSSSLWSWLLEMPRITLTKMPRDVSFDFYD